jgi:ankyrin repeat protein
MPLGLADCRYDFTSLSVRSNNLQSSAFQREFESLVPQDSTWPSNTFMAANDLSHSELHMNVNVDTVSASSVISLGMELPKDSDSLSFSPGAIYARGFIRQNDVRSSNLNSFPADSSLREIICPGGFSMPDFATSMFPVISRMFPRAVSSPHLVIFGNNSAFESALRKMSGPSTLQLVRQQNIDHQIIYMVFQRLINDSDAVSTLDEPKTELDHLFKTGIIHCFSLGTRILNNLINYTPAPFDLALRQNIFLAALVLGNGPVLRAVLETDRDNLTSRPFNIENENYLPLEYTVHKGHIQATEVLLDQGADPNLPAAYEERPDDGSDTHFLGKIVGSPWDNRDRQVAVRILQLLIDHGLEFKPSEFVSRIRQCSKGQLSILATHCLDKSFETFFRYRGLSKILEQPEWDDPFAKTLKAILNNAFLEINGRQEMWDSELSYSLSAAVRYGRATAVDILLSMGATPDTRCLVSAAQSNDVQIFTDFLSRGLDPISIVTGVASLGYDPRYLCTALSESILNHSKGAFEVLQEKGFISNLSHRPAAFAMAFVAACRVGDSNLIEQLLSIPKFPRREKKLEQAIEAAMEGGQYHVIKRLLSAGIKPNVKSLRLAIQEEQLTTAVLLARCVVTNDTLIDDSGEQRNFILWEALRWGNQTIIECVLRMGQPVNISDELLQGKLRDWNLLPTVQPPDPHGSWRYTPLSAAVLAGNTSAVKTLMTYGVQAVSFRAHGTSYQSFSGAGAETVDYDSGWTLTPLAAAAKENDLPLIREFLRIGADPFDNVALFMCAMNDFKEDIVTLLLSAFRTRYPNGAQSFGSDASYWAMRRGNTQLLELLAKDVDLTGPVEKDRGPDQPQSSFRHNTVFTSPLGEAVRHHAESEGIGRALDHLLPLVKDLNAIVHKTWKGGDMTSLLYAISLNSLATVQKLHQAGADISLPAGWLIPRTPLQGAAQIGSKDIVEYLLKHDVDPNEAPAERGGATALQLAAIKGNVGVATVLLNAGADINAPPAFCDGRTAFEGATEHGCIEMMIFLVGRGADLLSNGSVQYRRAVEFAEDNAQHAARKLADELYGKVSASQGPSFIDMGADAWAGVGASGFENFL